MGGIRRIFGAKGQAPGVVASQATRAGAAGAGSLVTKDASGEASDAYAVLEMVAGWVHHADKQKILSDVETLVLDCAFSFDDREKKIIKGQIASVLDRIFSEHAARKPDFMSANGTYSQQLSENLEEAGFRSEDLLVSLPAIRQVIVNDLVGRPEAHSAAHEIMVGKAHAGLAEAVKHSAGRQSVKELLEKMIDAYGAVMVAKQLSEDTRQGRERYVDLAELSDSLQRNVDAAQAGYSESVRAFETELAKSAPGSSHQIKASFMPSMRSAIEAAMNTGKGRSV